MSLHLSALRMSIQAVCARACKAYAAHAPGWIIVDIAALWMHEEAALALAFSTEPADGAIRILVNAAARGMHVGALGVLAGTAILALDATGTFPWKLLSRRAVRRRLVSTWYRHQRCAIKGCRRWQWNN